jgi:hypothetical protein
LNALNTPLQADGLSRRVYPFIGLAIVGLVSLHGYSGVTASPVLAGALAAAMPRDRERCLAAGMDDYISKPVKLHIVAAVLERWLAVPSAN